MTGYAVNDTGTVGHAGIEKWYDEEIDRAAFTRSNSDQGLVGSLFNSLEAKSLSQPTQP